MSKIPDVAFFIPKLGGGGAERVFCTLANHLSKEYCVDIVLVNERGSYLNELNNGIRIFDLGSRKTISSLPRLLGYIRRNKPPVLLSTTFMATYVAVAAKIVSSHDFRSVVRIPNVPTKHMSSWNVVQSTIGQTLAKVLYPRADQVIAISEGVEKDLITNFGCAGKSTTIYNPIDIDKIHSLSEMPVDQKPFFSDNPVILGAGRLTQQKDFFTLIRAFDEMRVDGDLVILGDGELRDELEQLATELGVIERTYFPGFVENPYKFMKASDVFVLSSAWEGFGNVLVEAMACTTPVVSTDCKSGPREILDDGRVGPLVPIADPVQLAEAITDTLEDPVDAETLEMRAAEFSVEQIVSEYEQVLFDNKR